MVVLQVVGDRPRTGKTCLVAALLLQLADQRKPAAYFKPFSLSPDEDRDFEFITGQLLTDPSAPPPRPLPTGAAATGGQAPAPGWSGAELEAWRSTLTADSRTALVEGPDRTGADGGESSLAGELAARLDSRVLALFGYRKGLSADSIAQAAGDLGDRLAGVVINNVGQHRLREVRAGLVTDLRGRGIPVLGALPEDRRMLAVTVGQIAEHLGARWVQEPANPEAWVDRFLIGGNIMDSGINYFGRYTHQAVITRAERPDIQMASLMTATRCLVLTGGAEPTEYVRVEAAKREVPLALVSADTLQTAEALGGILGLAHPYSLPKARRFSELTQQHLDPDLLAAVLQQS